MQNKEDICRYCLQNSITNKSKLIKPCACTNPICVLCLKRRNRIYNAKRCEICKTIFCEKKENVYDEQDLVLIIFFTMAIMISVCAIGCICNWW